MNASVRGFQVLDVSSCHTFCTLARVPVGPYMCMGTRKDAGFPGTRNIMALRYRDA